MEVKNRIKGLDLIDRVIEELWTEVHDIVQEAGTKTIKKKKCKKANLSSEKMLKLLRKEEKLKAKEKGKIYPFKCNVPKNSKER